MLGFASQPPYRFLLGTAAPGTDAIIRARARGSPSKGVPKFGDTFFRARAGIAAFFLVSKLSKHAA